MFYQAPMWDGQYVNLALAKTIKVSRGRVPVIQALMPVLDEGRDEGEFTWINLTTPFDNAEEAEKALDNLISSLKLGKSGKPEPYAGVHIESI